MASYTNTTPVAISHTHIQRTHFTLASSYINVAELTLTFISAREKVPPRLLTIILPKLEDPGDVYYMLLSRVLP